MIITDPVERQQQIERLRALVDRLEAEPWLPVPPHIEVRVHVSGSDAEAAATIQRVARMLGEPADLEAHHPDTRWHQGESPDGGVTYRVFTVPDESMERWYALNSYAGNIQPDDSPEATRG